MDIKMKLSFQFTIIVAGVLLFFSALVYYFSYTSLHNRFLENLTTRAKNTAILLINVTEVDSALLKKIHQSTISWEREEIALTDSSHQLIYGNNMQYLTKEVMRNYSEKGNNTSFSIDEKEGICYTHLYKNRKYFVFVMAYDRSSEENLSTLLEILFWSILLSLWLAILLSYIFSRKAIKPISDIVNRVKTINASRLSLRLDEGNKKDEIAQLAKTFNQMLSDLELVFKNQQDFVSNASHELRTPLTVMAIEADYLLSHEHTTEEYVKYLSGFVNDLKEFNTLINALLELAHLNRDKTIQLSEIRIDEVILHSIHLVKAKYKGRRIIPKIQYPENPNDMVIEGNSELLVIAFRNLIENACKFSNHDVIVEVVMHESTVKVIISDTGMGIPAKEIDRIFLPFTRGSNVTFKGGFGIGLSLVIKILELHNVNLQIHSSENVGTECEMTFSRLYK